MKNKNLNTKPLLFLTLALTLIISLDLSAQNNQVPGYIVTNEKDTLRGYLEDEIDSELRSGVNFSSTNTTVSQPYTPSEILGFGYDTGRSFFSIDAADGSGRIFVKNMATGKINVLMDDDKVSRILTMYLSRIDTSISVVLEPPKKNTIEKDGKKFSSTDKKYLQLLSFITGDVNLPNINYNEKKIVGYLNEYNQRYASTIPTTTYSPLVKTSYDVSLGYPTLQSNAKAQYRFAFFRDRKYFDKHRTLHRRAGFSYRLLHNKSGNVEHFLNLLPVGVRLESGNGAVVPYVHASGGVALSLCGCSTISTATSTTTEYSLSVAPGLNLGLGARFKFKSGALFTEITPAFNEGFMLNLGFEF